MFGLMKRSKQQWIGLAAGALIMGAGGDAWADTKTNPYDLIVERNPFGLKPPPPPPDPNEVNKPPPAAPPATVELTGITSILSSKKALFEIIPGPGKPMIKPILSEGERIESVEVVSINVDKNEVTVKNGGITTNLTFKVAKSTGPGAPGAVPGSIPPPVIPGAIPPTPTQPQTSYNQQQGSGRYNVMVGGGNTVTPASAPGVPNYGGGINPGLNTGVAPAVNTGVPNTDTGFRSIPSRNLRTTPQAQEGAISREEQYQILEANRLKNEALRQMSGGQISMPPLPPTPYTPPDAPGYVPRFPPLPGGPPPLPNR